MKPSNLAVLLTSAFAAHEPVLVTGAPGIGKSQIIERVTMKLGAKMILSHPAVSDPTDIKGLPWAEQGAKRASFLPFGELAEAMEATSETVWFFDDLGQASPAVQASCMQLFLARRVNGHRLPDCVTLVAATNRRKDKAGVTGILEPVKSRFCTIVELQPDLDEWTEWAYAQSWMPPELIGFLRFRGADLLCAFEATQDLTNSPMPRTWANVGKLLAMQLPAEVEAEAIAGAVGQGAASELMGYLRLWRKLPSIDAILIDPDTQPIPEEPSVLYAVATALTRKANPQNFSRIGRWAERLYAQNHGEFAALIVRDILRGKPELVQTADFNRLVAGPIGQLMSGGRN